MARNWRTFWNQRRALIGYLILVTVVVAALELHHISDDRFARRAQRAICENSRTITMNQRLVLSSLIDLRVAALSSPYLQLEAQRELPKLQAALDAIKDDPECE